MAPAQQKSAPGLPQQWQQWPDRIWWFNTISFASKFKLYKSLVTSIHLYGCETWTLLADSEKWIQAFVTKCMRKLLRISSPQWGAADAEIKVLSVQSTELKGSPFKAWSR